MNRSKPDPKSQNLDRSTLGDIEPETGSGRPSQIIEMNAGLPAHLQDLTDRARNYVEAASSANTRRAYASDWKHFTAWCRRQNLSPLPWIRRSLAST